jgi:hypothetical protein
MPSVATSLLLTPAFDAQKQLAIVGGAAVNERVAVTIVNVEDVAASGLVLRLVSTCGRIEYARFPSLSTDVWTVDGTNTTGTLDLNTAALRAAFRCRRIDDTIAVDVFVENGTTDNLYARGTLIIGNWPQNPLDPVAGSSTLQSEIDALALRIEEHQHDATVEGESAFPHNNLTERDATGAHPAIEGALETLQTAVQQNTSGLSTLSNNVALLSDSVPHHSDFADVAQLSGSATLKATIAKLNAILTILKG